MSWLYVVIAGLFEMAGVGAINRLLTKRGLRSLMLVIFLFSGSFFFLYLAMKQLPMGVAYAVWTGIGTAGGAILGMLFYGEPKERGRIFFIAVIIVSVVGLKVVAG